LNLSLSDLSDDSQTPSGSKKNGEKSETRGPCGCGYKHWYNGKEYDVILHLSPPGSNQDLYIPYNMGDDPYVVAAEYLASKGVRDWNSDQAINLGSWIEQVTTPYFEQYKQQQNTAVPASVPSISAGHSNVLRPSQEELQKMQKEREEHKRAVEKEKEKEKAEINRIKDRINNDRLDKSPVHIGNVKPMQLGGGGIRTLNDTKKKKDEEKNHNNNNQNDDEDENIDEEAMKLLFKQNAYPDKWTNDMVLYKYRELGSEQLANLLQKCGASNTQIQQLIQWAASRPSPQKKIVPPPKFSGEGHRLRPDSSNTPINNNVNTNPVLPTNPTPASSNQVLAVALVLHNNSPQTQLRVTLYNNQNITITINEDHTVMQLLQHIRHVSNVPQFHLVGGFPRKRVDDKQDLTIKQAGLCRGSFVQSLPN